MTATVFDVFTEQIFEYLTISRGEVYGNRVVDSWMISGIFKERNNMNISDREVPQSSATAHVHPEDFADVSEIIGNGVRYHGKDYTIVKVTEGRNFDNNKVEHLTLTLERANYVERNGQD